LRIVYVLVLLFLEHTWVPVPLIFGFTSKAGCSSARADLLKKAGCEQRRIRPRRINKATSVFRTSHPLVHR
jgi:hypothetical protein